jgi:hypothetical protein
MTTQFADIDLKPCPFCGGEATFDGYTSGGCFVACLDEKKDCPVTPITNLYDTYETAANKWNGRAE